MNGLQKMCFDLNGLTTEELEAFVEVCACGSIHGASDALGVDADHIKLTMKSMEAKFGQQLFQRAGTLRLTPGARKLHAYVAVYVDAFRSLRQRIDPLSADNVANDLLAGLAA